DGIQGAIILVAGGYGGFVQPSLTDDGVDADRRLAGGPVADDQLPLAAANRNHRINRHDAGLHRLVHGLAADDAGRHLLDRIGDVALDGPFAIDWLAQCIYHAPQQPLSDRRLQELAGGAGFTAL